MKTHLSCLSSAKAAAFLLVAATSLAAAGSAAAQTNITFGAAQTIAADTDVLNTGTTFLAFAFANTYATVTVNGVTFSNNAPGSNLTISGFPANHSAFDSSFAPYSSLSAGYRSLLSGGLYNVAAPPDSFLISGLTPGEQYEAQFFVSDPRFYGVGRTETLTGGTTLAFNSTGQEGGVGQFADSSLFTVDASGTATFTVTAGPNLVTQVNAFQVRDLGPAPAVPEASTTVSFGLLLSLGLGGVVVAAKRRKTNEKAAAS